MNPMLRFTLVKSARFSRPVLKKMKEKQQTNPLIAGMKCDRAARGERERETARDRWRERERERRRLGIWVTPASHLSTADEY